MAAKADPRIIGGFVIGAIALLVAGILLFGAGRLLGERETFVMYFDGSVKGLSIGAPVVFKGVRLGTVKEILLRFDPSDMSVQIPVFVEFEEKRITRVKGPAKQESYTQELIDRGLKAQLQLQSMVTGQLMINLDFHPDQPIRLLGADPEFTEIPTISTGLQELAKTIQDLPLKELVEKVVSTVDTIDRFVQSPDFTDTARNLNQTLKSLRQLAARLDRQLGPLLTHVDGTVQDTRHLVRNADAHLAVMASDLTSATEAAKKAAANLESTLNNLENVTGEDSTLLYRLNTALEEISAMARAVQVWTDFIEQQPEALLRGKRNPQER